MKSPMTIAVAALSLLGSGIPVLAETIDCTNIATVPFTITVQGVYCLKQHIGIPAPTGVAITIATNNVTIDFNDFKLGGLGAGPTTQATGVYALNRQNITLRNANIRGFQRGIALEGATSSGHLIEDSLIDGSTEMGILLGGSGSVVRRNRIIGTDSTPPSSGSAALGNRTSAISQQSSTGRRTTASDGVTSQAGAGEITFGIFVKDLKNSQIVDNLISTTVSPVEAYGIKIEGTSANIEIARNRIIDTRGDAFGEGLWVDATMPPGTAVLAKDNTIVKGAGDTSLGIDGTSGTLLCLDNTISGFASGQTAGCSAQAGTFPPAGP